MHAPMKKRYFNCIAVALLLAWGNSVFAAKPDFVITIADDHGVYHSSVYGSPEFETPNMQQLAADGMRFDNAYVASPACAPSRAALFTGQMPYSNGIVGNHEVNLKPGVRSLLPMLIDQGYEIVFHGKVGHGRLMHHEAYVPDQVKVLGPGGLQRTRTLTDVETFLRDRPRDAPPLALFLGWTDTHTVWPPEEEVRIQPSDVVIPPRIYDTPEARREMSRYVEAAERIDRRLGETRELLAKHLDPDNTLVIYTSDHGFAWPFAKWSLYETGIRTPFIVAWPGKIKPGTTTDAMVSWIDLLPTMIDLAGGTPPDAIDGKSFADVLLGESDHHRDAIFATHKGDKGMNVYPIRSVRVGDYKYILNLHPEFAFTTHTDVLGSAETLKPGTPSHGGLHWRSYLEAAKTDPAAAAFLRDYHSSPAEELYQIADDPFEQNNLADSPEHAEKLVELREMVAQRMREVGDDESLSGEPRLLSDFPLPDLQKSPPRSMSPTAKSPPAKPRSRVGSWGDQGDGTYRNPVLESNYPDNDVIRVGDTFYMMSSTNHHTPGMTILKSKDLVNWEFSNTIMPAPITFDQQFEIGQVPSMENRGTWAGSFGFNGESYFAYWCFNRLHLSKNRKENQKYLTIVFSKADSMEGPWSEPKEIKFKDGTSIDSTDPGVFWDMETKRAYLAAHHKYIYEMSWDGTRLLDNKHGGIEVGGELHGEAVKLFKFDGWYYYMNAHWHIHEGVRQRMATFARAKQMEGPWESRLAMENGNGTDRSPSQGTLLKLEDGTWWFIHQVARGTAEERYNGRPQMLEPVSWKDGWPLIGVDTDGDGIGEVVWHHKKPINGFPVTAPATDDDFDRPKLGPQWLWRFNPRVDRYSLTERPGYLRLTSCVRASAAKTESLDQLPNLLGQRLMGQKDNVITTKFDLSGMAVGQESGFHVSAKENNVIGVKKAKDGTLRLIFKHGDPAGPTVVNGPRLEQSDIWFRSSIENGLANFFYSLDGETFVSLGPQVRLLFSGFTPNMAGFYSMNTTEDGHVDIDWITYDYDGPKCMTFGW
ncbi:sulfatase and gycosyl hydrolase family 43 domain protein [Rhodopirellula sp. SWK7]|nr:sulfatase and gycosyl hydrolase family 43 domain protein [Rhodopirellula sp. SWK7]